MANGFSHAKLDRGAATAINWIPKRYCSATSELQSCDKPAGTPRYNALIPGETCRTTMPSFPLRQAVRRYRPSRASTLVDSTVAPEQAFRSTIPSLPLRHAALQYRHSREGGNPFKGTPPCHHCTCHLCGVGFCGSA